MNTHSGHHHADDPVASSRKRPSSPRRAWAYPPRSLLCVGVSVRLSVAALATGVLWLTVLWALN